MIQAEATNIIKSNNVYLPEPLRTTNNISTSSKGNKQQRMFLLKSGLAIFVFSLLLVFLCIQSAVLCHQIDCLEKEIGQLENSSERLDYQIAQGSSLERVEQVAVQELGMHKPDLDASLMVEADPGTVTVAESNESVAKPSRVSQNPLHQVYAGLSSLAQRNFNFQ